MGNFHRDTAEKLNDALVDLDEGNTSSVTVAGVTYTAANRDTLETALTLHCLKGCRLEILSGALRSSILGREFSRPDLPALNATIRDLEQRQTSASRGGIRQRTIVPTG